MGAARGRHDFGVVTELVLALHEVDPLANVGLFFWRPEDAAGPLAFARDYLFDLTPEMGALIVGVSAPPEPFVPVEHRGIPGSRSSWRAGARPRNTRRRSRRCTTSGRSSSS